MDEEGDDEECDGSDNVNNDEDERRERPDGRKSDGVGKATDNEKR